MKFENRKGILTNAPSIDSSNNILLGTNRGLKVQQVRSTYEMLDINNDKADKGTQNTDSTEYMQESEVQTVGVNNCFRNKNKKHNDKENDCSKVDIAKLSISKDDFGYKNKTNKAYNWPSTDKEIRINRLMSSNKMDQRSPTEIFDDIYKNKERSDMAILRLLESSVNYAKEDGCNPRLQSTRGKETWSFADAYRPSKLLSSGLIRSDPSQSIDNKKKSEKLAKTYKLMNAYLESENTILRDKLRILQAKKSNYNIFKNKYRQLQGTIFELQCPYIHKWMETQALVRGNISNPIIRRLKQEVQDFK